MTTCRESSDWSLNLRSITRKGVLTVLLLSSIIPASAQDWRRPESRDRGKEFVGFIQPEQLYWRPFVLPGVQQADFKLLSFDESTQARTQILRLPPGWKQAPGYHSVDLEMFVLEGGIEAGDTSMGRYAYAFYPAGYAHEMRTRAVRPCCSGGMGSRTFSPVQNPDREQTWRNLSKDGTMVTHLS